MVLKHPKVASRPPTLSVDPLFTTEGGSIPRHRLPESSMDPDVAYQIIHDELMLDGNARTNLATFVSTWMEPQADKLMAECFDKNMIDKDEYPQTAELEMRCVEILGRLWNAPDSAQATGCSTTGSSEAPCSVVSPSSAGGRSGGPLTANPPTSPIWSWASTCRSAGRSSPTTGTWRCDSSRWRATVTTSPPRRR